MTTKSTAIASPTVIESMIYLFRGQRVMLDTDLAILFNVPVRVLNQAVKRNAERFPDDFAFQLTAKEFTFLRSQTVISKIGRGGRRYHPWAFTEHGIGMLAGVLDSPTAIRMHLEIIRAFIRLQRLIATPGELITQLRQLAETVQLHDEQIKVITDLLTKMLTPTPPDPHPRRIGFVPHKENTP